MNTRPLVVLVLLVVGLFSTACVPNMPNLVDSDATTTHSVPSRQIDGYVRKIIGDKEWVVPVMVDIDKWLPMGRILTQREADIMHLQKGKLPYGGFYHNELRERRTFEVTWLETGTEVWMTSDGTARYLVSCGNLIAPTFNITLVPTSVKFPKGIFRYRNGDEEVGRVIDSATTPTPVIVPFRKVEATAGTPVAQGSKTSRGTLDNLIDFLKSALAISIGAIAVMLLLWLIWQLAHFLNWNWAPQPVHQPAPAVMVAPAPAAEPTATRTTRMGPFKKVNVNDRQTDGFHVTADGREIGVYRNPVYTEDAGEKGHYVVTEETI